MANTSVPIDAVPIEVNGRVSDPRKSYARDAKKTNYLVVGSYGVLTPQQCKVLETLGISFLEDLGNDNMLCGYAPDDLQPLRALDFIRQVDVYRNSFKVPSELYEAVRPTKDDTTSRPSASQSINAMFHHDITNLNSLAKDIAERADLDVRGIEVVEGSVRLELPTDQIERLVVDDRIRVIEKQVTPILHDGQAKSIIGAGPERSSSFTSHGQGQVIAIADSGFDLGSIEDCHPVFDGKILALIALGRSMGSGLSEAETMNDPEGHGTHVCGTIVAQDVFTSQGLIGGVAQEAKLVVTSLLVDKRTLMKNIKMDSLLQRPYQEHGARIYSNSWGDGLGEADTQTRYTASAADVDTFVRNSGDAFVCFSAGNNNKIMSNKKPVGIQKPSVGSQAAAKNCLTVGATGSTRKVLNPRHGEAEYVAPDRVCSDSSRGPTINGRVKPDVVAPGFNIFSAQSRHPAVRYEAATSTCASMSDVSWKIRCGTSHSTPLVAGCAAVLRAMLQQRGVENPPSALLKAVIINGAEILSDVDTEAQGFGRVDLQASMKMVEEVPLVSSDTSFDKIWRQQAGTMIGCPLSQDQETVFQVLPVPSGEETHKDAMFKVTMAYNDLAGAHIQNNLNLTVIESVSGILKRGGSSPDDLDKHNNVEQVVWTNLGSAPLTIRVKAQKIFPHSSQDFAVAWSVCSC